LKPIIENLKTKNILIRAIVCDNASVNICALNHLNGVIKKTNYVLGSKVALVRCCAHTLDLCLMDYCNRFKLKEELTDILNENNITNWIIVTRWTSLEEAFKRLNDLKVLPTKYHTDFIIVKAVTKAIRLIESDFAGIDVYD